MSTLINVAGSFIPALFARTATPAVGGHVVTEGSPFSEPALGRLAKRDACESSAVSPDEYNTPLHVGALVIILAVSGLACAVPMLASKFPILRIPEPFFFGVRHFGTGVLLATAFVHLLPTAFISLGNPCLSNFWTTDYPAMPGAIALVGIFFVSIIEMVFSPARHFTPRGGSAESDGTDGQGTGTGTGRTQAARSSVAGGHYSNAAVVAAVTRPSTTRRGSVVEPAPPREAAAPAKQPDISKETLEIESQGAGLTPEQLHKKAILQCMLLEVGILFHSVFIGMALSVAVGSNFVVLLIAIAFHREFTSPPAVLCFVVVANLTPTETFEGLALGARIASIAWPEKTLQPWLMILAYGCT